MKTSDHIRWRPERRHRRVAPRHEAQVSPRADSDMTQVFGAAVRDGAVFDLSPDAFGRICISRVRREILEHDLVTLRSHMGMLQLQWVGLKSTPDDQELLGCGRLEGSEKLGDPSTLDQTIEQPEVVAPVSESRNDGKLFPSAMIVRHRRLSVRCSGLCTTTSLGQTRLFDEDDYSALPRSDLVSLRRILALHVGACRLSRAYAWPVLRRYSEALGESACRRRRLRNSHMLRAWHFCGPLGTRDSNASSTGGRRRFGPRFLLRDSLRRAASPHADGITPATSASITRSSIRRIWQFRLL